MFFPKGFERRNNYFLLGMLSYSYWESALLKCHSKCMDAQGWHHCGHVRVGIFSKSFFVRHLKFQKLFSI